MALTHMVSAIEVCKTFWSLGEDKVPRLNRFPSLFFHQYWPIIKGQVVDVYKWSLSPMAF